MKEIVYVLETRHSISWIFPYHANGSSVAFQFTVIEQSEEVLNSCAQGTFKATLMVILFI